MFPAAPAALYHEVSQLQPPSAAVEENVVLLDDGALRLAEGSCLLGELHRVAHFGFDLHVGRHGSTERVQNMQQKRGRQVGEINFSSTAARYVILKPCDLKRSPAITKYTDANTLLFYVKTKQNRDN